MKEKVAANKIHSNADGQHVVGGPGKPVVQANGTLRLAGVFRTVYADYDLKLVPMDPCRHIGMMHSWANKYYATKYWQMNGDFNQFREYYKQKLERNDEQVLIAYLADIPVAQIEVYLLKGSPLDRYVDPGPGDMGFHFLMAPHRELINHFKKQAVGLSKAVLQCVLEQLFYNLKARNVMAEPDKENINACILAEKAGFTFQREIALDDKIAALYLYKRADFLEKYPGPMRDGKHKLFGDTFNL